MIKQVNLYTCFFVSVCYLEGYINITSLRHVNKNLKVMIGIGGWKEGSLGFGRCIIVISAPILPWKVKDTSASVTYGPIDKQAEIEIRFFGFCSVCNVNICNNITFPSKLKTKLKFFCTNSSLWIMFLSMNY